MSLIDSITHVRSTALGAAATNTIYGHLGFTLALRRELLPMIQHTDTTANAAVFGLRIIESEHIPHGHYIINGVSYRYTKPTLDEMVAEAKQYLAMALEGDVEVQRRAIERSFKIARERLGVTNTPYILQRQAA